MHDFEGREGRARGLDFIRARLRGLEEILGGGEGGQGWTLQAEGLVIFFGVSTEGATGIAIWEHR